ncbi:MAG: hypothetical protein HQK75_10740 [Candidatus Magnetomorum sp.]|nr:hypothetical protein [Candidatus Magnetomorum sp.]
MLLKQIKRFVLGNKGQGMVEYIIVNATIVMAFALTTALIIPSLSQFYHIISTMVKLPIS